MSRTRRFLQGMRLGYLNQAVTTIVGIWLTPFLLGHLGETHYGIWLTITQLLGYLLLLDLGVVFLVPRETAYAVGRGGGMDETREIAPLLGRTLRIVAWQLPILAAAAGALWLLLPARWEDARSVLLPILILFLVCWPFRVFLGALEGLQQFRFTGRLTLGLWAAQTLVTVVLVAAGVGLQSLAWGWAVTQLGGSVAAVAYMWVRFPQHVPRSFPKPSGAELRDQLERGFWVTVVQLATTLVYATDVVIIAHVLGPAATVPYAITAKLVLVLQNQPQILIHGAMPGLSELNAAGDRVRVTRAMSALSLGLLAASGAIAMVVIVVNEGFVRWWIDAGRFGGLPLTVAMGCLMLVRHWAVMMNYVNFTFGGDRKMALINLADAVVTVGGAVLLVRAIGIIGAPIASLAGAALVGIPLGLRLLGRSIGDQLPVLLRSLWPIVARLPLLLAGATLVASRWTPDGPVELILAGAVTGVVYLLVMGPIVARSVLADYVIRHVPARVGRWVRALGGRDAEPRPSAP